MKPLLARWHLVAPALASTTLSDDSEGARVLMRGSQAAKVLVEKAPGALSRH
jgi:hypothetical protein